MSTVPYTRRAFSVRALHLALWGGTLHLGGLPSLSSAHPVASATLGAQPANAVILWNAIAERALEPTQGTNPMSHSRVLAILHASIHDALNAIVRRYEPYTIGLPAVPEANPDVAVAAAARAVLVRLVPDQAALVQSAYAHALEAAPAGETRRQGVVIGLAAASATLARRRADGSVGADRVYVPGTAPGEYRFTPPFDFAAQPGWGGVTPFLIELTDHFLEGPQAIDGVDYALDLAFVRDIGGDSSTRRTPEQTEIAKFWYEDSTLGWNRIANAVIRRRGVDAWESARGLALLHFAMADGFIAGFHEKYRHRFWRPLTAIHAAAEDGNSRTEADTSWQPLLPTPPVPDYPSTHTVLGWAAAEVLITLFGDDEVFETTSLTLPGVIRKFRGFSAPADENGRSRLYAGIHFQHAVRDGRRQGRAIGQAVARALPRSS